MMQAVTSFFEEFDLFGASATLRIRGEKQMQSSLIGLILFLISCFFTYIFIIECVGILKFESIDAQLSDVILPQSEALGYINILAIRVGNLTTQQIFSMFAPVHVTVTLQQQYMNQNGLNWQRLIPCTPEHWVSFSENYNSTFYQYGMDKMLCLNLTQPAQINETQLSWTCTNLIIKLFMCDFDKKSNPNCNSSKGLNYLQNHNNIQISVYLPDTGFFPVQKQPTKPFVNIDSKILISWLMTTNLEIQYASYKIDTDSSLISFASTQQITGIWVSSLRTYARPYNYSDSNLDLTKITITMNQNLRVYQRTIGKLDNQISYVGGLFQIVIAFIAFFLQNFNEYRYQLQVGEGAFDFNENRKKIKSTDMTFITYIKYSLYDWINTLFCTKIKWKLCNEIQEVRQQIISHMEVNRFYNRIRNAEKAVTYALGEPKTDFIRLVEPPTVQKVNIRKLKIDYFDKITENRVVRKTEPKIIQTEDNLQSQQILDNNAEIKAAQPEVQNKFKEQNLKSIELDHQLIEIEKDFSNSFFALNEKLRNQYKNRICSQILQRLKEKRSE